MAKVREQFVGGATERGVDTELSEQIFDLMEKFSGYAFNKSHSATYALVSFQTAWLKTHHPAQFMAATLSVDMQNTDKVVTLADEVRHMGLPLVSPLPFSSPATWSTESTFRSNSNLRHLPHGASPSHRRSGPWSFRGGTTHSRTRHATTRFDIGDGPRTPGARPG